MIPKGTIGPLAITSNGFWIYSDGKPVFYYSNGKIYIKELILYKELKYSADGSEFNEAEAGYVPSSGGGGSGGGGGDTPTPTPTVPTIEYR